MLSCCIDFMTVKKSDKMVEFLISRFGHIIKNQTEIGFYKDAFEDEGISKEKKRRGFFDNQVDMSVVMLKMFCYTGDNTYLDSADICLNSILKFCQKPFGFVDYVNVETGSNYNSRHYLKYQTLFLKLLILHHLVHEGENILEKNEWFILTIDR